MSTEVALAVVAVMAVAGLAVALRQASRVRHATRHISRVARALDRNDSPGAHGLDGALARLDRAAGALQQRVGEGAVTERRMAAALAAVDDGVVILDPSGDLLLANPSAAAYLGSRHGEALVDAAVRELAGEAGAGKPSTRTLELFGPPRRTLVLTATPLVPDDDTVLGVLVVIDDVTEQYRLDAVRRDFVANISHELKTPVGGLGVLAETLLEEADPEIVQRLAARMHEDALRASRTIDDLLELSRIEAGETMLRDPVDVEVVLAEAIERAAGAAEQDGVRLVLAGPSGRAQVYGDRRQLVSATFNLLDNAVKYSEAGSAVQVSAATDGQFVRIVVRDEGVGIPRRDLDRIFERFYRVDRARGRETGGTGLGLAIVRHVVANHGGEIDVDSREGQGSVFTLRIPAGLPPVAVAAETG